MPKHLTKEEKVKTRQKFQYGCNKNENMFKNRQKFSCQTFCCIFLGVMCEENVYLPHYSGNPVGVQGEGLTCDQFCAIVENQIESFKWTQNEAFNYALRALTSPAMEWSFELKMDSWVQLKEAMRSRFQGPMTIQMKAELRKSLKQNGTENAKDFFNRYDNLF